MHKVWILTKGVPNLLKMQNIVQDAALKGLPQSELCVCAVTGARAGRGSLHCRKVTLEHLEVTCHTPRTHTNSRKSGKQQSLKYQSWSLADRRQRRGQGWDSKHMEGMVWAEGTLDIKNCPPAMGRDSSHHPRVLQAPSSPALTLSVTWHRALGHSGATKLSRRLQGKPE